MTTFKPYLWIVNTTDKIQTRGHYKSQMVLAPEHHSWCFSQPNNLIDGMNNVTEAVQRLPKH